MGRRTWTGLVLVLSLILSGCGEIESPRPGIEVPLPRAQSAAPVAQATPSPPSDVPTPVATEGSSAPLDVTPEVPLQTDSQAYFMLFFDLILNDIPMFQFQDVGLMLVPSPEACGTPGLVLDEVDLTLIVSLTSLEALDGDPTWPGYQVAINLEALPDPASLEVLDNTIDTTGAIHYHVRGLNYRPECTTPPTIMPVGDRLSASEFLPLFTLTLHPIAEGLGEITIYSLVAKTSEGVEVPIDYEDLVLNIYQQEEALPLPTATPMPTPDSTTPDSRSTTGGIPNELPVIVPAVLQEGVYYRILPGENLFRIGLRFGVPWTSIAQVNGIRDEHFVPAGMILYIPTAAPLGSSAYYIRRGDTLYSICRALNLRVVDVAALNGIPAPYNYIRADTWLMLAP